MWQSGESPTSYYVTSRYKDPDATRVRIYGEWRFSHLPPEHIRTGPQPPSGFLLNSAPIYYEVTTTASFSGLVTVCIVYDETTVQDESQLRLLHYEVDTWQDRTSSIDTTANVICATVASFSPFAVFEAIVPPTATFTPSPTFTPEPTLTPSFTPTPAPLTITIDIKPGDFPNSVNLGSNGTVAVAIFSTPTFDATTVDPLSIVLASAPVQLRGKGSPMISFEDMNGDGLLDLLVHVSTQALQLTDMDTEAVLEGTTTDGVQIQGVDTIRVVP